METPRARWLLLIAAQLVTSSAWAQARDAVLRKRLDQHGDLIFAGNSVHTCTAGQSGCGTAQTQGGTQDDNDFTMIYVDTDGDSGTFNSSSSTLALPQGASVSWARLYWMCTRNRGTNPPDTTKRNQ